MSDTLQRSAVRNAKSMFFFWTGFRCSLGALEEVYPGEKRQVQCVPGGAKESARGAHPTLVQGAPLLSNLGCGLLQVEGPRGTSAGKAQK